mgnify:FL=1
MNKCIESTNYRVNLNGKDYDVERDPQSGRFILVDILNRDMRKNISEAEFNRLKQQN